MSELRLLQFQNDASDFLTQFSFTAGDQCPPYGLLFVCEFCQYHIQLAAGKCRKQNLGNTDRNDSKNSIN